MSEQGSDGIIIASAYWAERVALAWSHLTD